MTMQDSGKGGAAGGGPVGAPRLDLDQADELAATFRPAWEVDEEPAATLATASEGAPETAAEASKAATLPLGSRPPAPSTEAVDSANVIEVAPAASPGGKTLPLAADPDRTLPARAAVKPASVPPAKAAPTNAVTLASAKNVAVAADPFGAPAAPARDATSPSALATEELEALVPKRGKGMVYGAIGVGIALAVGIVLKLALSEEPPAPPTTAATTTATIAAPTTEIPPPPPKEDLPPPAPPSSEPAPKAAMRAAEPPSAPPATTPVAAAPPPRPEPKAATTPAARPAPRAAPRSAPESPAPAAPKTAPKSPAGGIVRDNPF